MIGFFGIQPPAHLTSVSRVLSDFLCYLIQPHQRILENEKSNYMSIDSVLEVENVHIKLVMPSYKFKTKLGIRNLTKKEVCNIWGLPHLNNSPLDIKTIIYLTPVQPLSLVLTSYLKPLRPSLKQTRKFPIAIPSKPASNSRFPSTNTTIDDSWTLVDLDAERSKKADNAPVPSELWDHRLLLSFDSRVGVLNLVTSLRESCLRWYRKKISS